MRSGETMTTAIIIGVYLLAGVATCVLAVVSRRANGVTALLLIPLWPLLGPALFQAGRREGEDRLVVLVRSVRAQLGTSAADREKRAIDGLLVHLLERRRRLDEVAAAKQSAPEKIHGRLDALGLQLAAELKAGEGLLEELSAQLMLVRLSGAQESGGHETDRVHVEELVASLEAIVHEAH